MAQLLAPYIDHESHSAQRYNTNRQTDRQTDRRHAYANSRSYCVAVRSAKNRTCTLFFLTSLNDENKLLCKLLRPTTKVHKSHR